MRESKPTIGYVNAYLSHGPPIRPLAEEVPLSLSFNGISHAVMMVTPHDLTAFIHGFSYSEGITSSKGEIKDIQFVHYDEGIEAQIELSNRSFYRLKEQKRNLAGRTGCGLCGKESLEQIMMDLARLRGSPLPSITSLYNLRERLYSEQTFAQVSGGLHSAALCSQSGEIVLNFEDVGRHNALDKLIGATLMENHDIQSSFVVLTSRCSYELIQKVVKLVCPTLITLSAPTTKALGLAKHYNVNLLHYTPQQNVLVYHQSVP
ncbi:formate dehydrogenase accessory sulfurtransferase FdhD [Vibrio sp.]|nr:formate dehydrogenase accessory sulfurtransferase FdhD [Vibrio sp.]